MTYGVAFQAGTSRLSTNWRSINAPNQLGLLLTGHRFVDGKLHLDKATTQEDVAV